MEDKFYTLRQLHDITHTSIKYFRRQIDEGKLKAVKISRDIIVSKDDFYKLLLSREVKRKDEK